MLAPVPRLLLSAALLLAPCADAAGQASPPSDLLGRWRHAEHIRVDDGVRQELPVTGALLEFTPSGQLSLDGPDFRASGTYGWLGDGLLEQRYLDASRPEFVGPVARKEVHVDGDRLEIVVRESRAEVERRRPRPPAGARVPELRVMTSVFLRERHPPPDFGDLPAAAELARFMRNYRAVAGASLVLFLLGERAVNRGLLTREQNRCTNEAARPELVKLLARQASEQLTDVRVLRELNVFLESASGKRIVDLALHQQGEALYQASEAKVNPVPPPTFTPADTKAWTAFQKTPAYAAFMRFAEAGGKELQQGSMVAYGKAWLGCGAPPPQARDAAPAPSPAADPSPNPGP